MTAGAEIRITNTDVAHRSGRQDVVGASEMAALTRRLSTIRAEALEVAEGWAPWVEGRHADRDASARNLLQYLALRRHDLRELQFPLIALGLSSLGGNEGHVQASLDAVLKALGALGHEPLPLRSGPPPIGFGQSRDLLARRTAALLGPAPRGRPTRIMVTMPSQAASDPALVRGMLASGMDCMRINCAHDDPPHWHAMLENLRRAEQHTRRRARVLVDLPGPKLRTGAAVSPAAHDATGDHLRLGVGDRLILTRDTEAGVPPSGEPRAPRMGCSLPEAFAVTRPGHHLWLDDGKLGGIVEAVAEDSIELRITSAAAKGAKLRPGKGINLPDAVLDVDLLGAHSEEALRFAAGAADIVGLSFVSDAHQVRRVSKHLDEHARRVGLILKIETRRAFEHLPGMLLAALGSERPAGVMIARGDLAVECGYERLAEVQEEILWLCQAAHLPVVWATQVLDRLAKTGRAPPARRSPTQQWVCRPSA